MLLKETIQQLCLNWKVWESELWNDKFLNLNSFQAAIWNQFPNIQSHLWKDTWTCVLKKAHIVVLIENFLMENIFVAAYHTIRMCKIFGSFSRVLLSITEELGERRGSRHVANNSVGAALWGKVKVLFRMIFSLIPPWTGLLL